MRTSRLAYRLSAASAAFATAAALAIAIALPTTAAAAQSSTSTAPSLTTVSSVTAKAVTATSMVAATNYVYTPCVTFIGEECYVSYIQGRGTSNVTFIFYNSAGAVSQITHSATCSKSACVETWSGYPGYEGDAIGFLVSGPDIRSVESF